LITLLKRYGWRRAWQGEGRIRRGEEGGLLEEKGGLLRKKTQY